MSSDVYRYRGCEITRDHDSVEYAGWWAIYDVGSSEVGGYYPTTRAAMIGIDLNPPSGE